ncbi:MAG: glycosyltransferase [Clostridia bacterium]|nr:glycosyltransferase [Clostridia bacterium]
MAVKDKFFFIATEPTPQVRLNLGYENMNDSYDFVIKMYESPANKDYAEKLLNDADIVIAGSCCFPFEMIVPRLENNKLTFWFSERLFKRGFLERFYPPKIKRVLSQCTKYRNKNFYLLCAGGYVAKDYAFYNAFKGKSFSWGYFPPVIADEKNNSENRTDQKLSLLWTARYLKWKHPEYIISAARALKKRGVDFEIKMIGNGKDYKRITKLIKKFKLENYVFQLGAIPSKEVRNYMDSADIFLFTSDANEGWGAVLNESMNSRCAVIANEAIGSVKSIIHNGFNGVTYKNKKQFIRELASLSQDRAKIEMLGNNAYDTIINLWSAECAVNRFYETATAILSNSKIPEYDSGPMKKIN